MPDVSQCVPVTAHMHLKTILTKTYLCSRANQRALSHRSEQGCVRQPWLGHQQQHADGQQEQQYLAKSYESRKSTQRNHCLLVRNLENNLPAFNRL